jgi:flagellar hook protein FlgE
MIDFSTPLAGLNAATTSLNQAANNIAHAGASPTGDNVDLTADAVALIQAKNDFGANVQGTQTEDDLMKSALSILG